LHIVSAEVAEAGERESEREWSVGPERIRLVAFGHDFAKEAFLRSEVIQEAGGCHPHPIGERGHAGAPVALGGEKLDGGVEDLLATKVPSGLGIALVSPG
jgi:hypothetical protein